MIYLDYAANNKYVNLIGGILLLIMGIILIFKPEWIMFSF